MSFTILYIQEILFSKLLSQEPSLATVFYNDLCICSKKIGTDLNIYCKKQRKKYPKTE